MEHQKIKYVKRRIWKDRENGILIHLQEKSIISNNVKRDKKKLKYIMHIPFLTIIKILLKKEEKQKKNKTISVHYVGFVRNITFQNKI